MKNKKTNKGLKSGIEKRTKWEVERYNEPKKLRNLYLHKNTINNYTYFV